MGVGYEKCCSSNPASSRRRPPLLHGTATLALQVLLLLTAAPPEAAAARQLLQAPCSNAASPVLESATVKAGSTWKADLSGKNNIKPGTTGVPAHLDGKASGTFELLVDEEGRKAAWTLKLCDVPQYIASHLHSGSPKADYPPPLIPLEPYTKPANPFGPPEQLPQLCPNLNIIGCAYSRQGSFIASDIIALPGRDAEVPAVKSWEDFLNALEDGKIYINVHSLTMPAGIIRGNLHPAEKKEEKKEEKKDEKKAEPKKEEKKDEIKAEPKKQEKKEEKKEEPKKDEKKDEKKVEAKPIVTIDVNKGGPAVAVGVLGVNVGVGDQAAKCPTSPSPKASPSASPSPSPSSSPVASTSPPPPSPVITPAPVPTPAPAVPNPAPVPAPAPDRAPAPAPVAAAAVPGSSTAVRPASGSDDRQGSSGSSEVVRPAAAVRSEPQVTRGRSAPDEEVPRATAVRPSGGSSSSSSGGSGGSSGGSSACQGLAPGSPAYVRAGCGA